MSLLDIAGVEQTIVPEHIQCSAVMDRTALVFIQKQLARQLAVAWKLCGGDDALWFDVAGVTAEELADAKRLAIALRVSGVCRDGGVLDEMAERYIAALLTASLGKPKNATEKNNQRKRRR